jgi:hypothetical protein
MMSEEQLLQEIHDHLQGQVENLNAFLDLIKPKDLDPTVKRYLRLQFYGMIASLDLPLEDAQELAVKFEELIKDK